MNIHVQHTNDVLRGVYYWNDNLTAYIIDRADIKQWCTKNEIFDTILATCDMQTSIWSITLDCTEEQAIAFKLKFC